MADNGQGFTEDLLEVLSEKQELEDEGGMTVEARVISSSVSMMVKGASKHKDLVAKVFRFFAVFPEDVPVPAPFFNKMVPLLSEETNEKRARLAVGSCLGTLLKYNLIKGSLSAGSGVFMHDIVRDYVIAQHSPEALRALQRAVVDVTLAARPEPQGFPASEFAAAGSFEFYVGRQLYWHMRHALEEGVEPSDAWLSHPDKAILANTAMAFGPEALGALSEAREKAGELVQAARASWCASWMKGIDGSLYADLVFRTSALLEKADDETVLKFELKVNSAAFMLDRGSEREQKSKARLKVLSASGEATFESKVGEALDSWNTGILIGTGFVPGTPQCDEPDNGGAMAALIEHNRLFMEAGLLTDNPSWRSFMGMAHPWMIGNQPALSYLPQWDPDHFGPGEEMIAAALEFYTYDTCSPVLKEMVVKCGKVAIPDSLLIFVRIVLTHASRFARFTRLHSLWKWRPYNGFLLR